MISFYPGPSRVHDEIPKYVKDAHAKGILSINHRSDEFVRISKRTVALLKSRLDIPEEYTVFFTSSATECWEIIAQSLISRKSYHLFNGSFGEKWHDYTKRLTGGVRSFPFHTEELINARKMSFDGNDGIICITQNETSNGTQVSNQLIEEIARLNPSHLICVDATSSMGGIMLEFKNADIWFASVQKCFGLPAGLGLMICSPKALDVAMKINEEKHYNSITFMAQMMRKFQTTYTPNVLGIYLLMRVLEDMKPIAKIHERTVKRYHQWADFLSERKMIRHLVANPEAHSFTVLPVAGEEELVEKIKSKARRQGLLLGEGYGVFKPGSFRIANFPALRKNEIKMLKEFLMRY